MQLKIREDGRVVCDIPRSHLQSMDFIGLSQLRYTMAGPITEANTPEPKWLHVYRRRKSISGMLVGGGFTPHVCTHAMYECENQLDENKWCLALLKRATVGQNKNTRSPRAQV